MKLQNTNRTFGISIIHCLLCFLFFITSVHGQTAVQIEQAKQKLSTMTPEQIDAAIKKYGMTRDEAEAKAKAVGIDLDSYLKAKSADNTTSLPQTQVNVQVGIPDSLKAQQNANNANTAQGALPAPATLNPTAQQSLPPKPQQAAPPILGPDSIPYFGYNIFRNGMTSFETAPNLTDNSYIIGKGDVLRISIWGDTQSSSDYAVDAQGRIIIPPAGPILIAGYTLDQARARVIQALSRTISGLATKPPTTSLDLSISQLRTIRAYMVGEVTNPGAYSFTTFTTVFNSLFSVGGPLVSGSLRDVRLIRNGKTVADVDLYDYLIGSGKTNDIRINDNDVIQVPLRGKTVEIRGAVIRSAYFELTPKEQLQKLLEFSGGIRNTFYLQRVQINRIIPFTDRQPGEPDRKIFDIDFTQILKNGKDYKLEDGDVVTVFPIDSVEENYVDIAGSVWRPGRYQLENVPTLKDLLVAADSLMPEAYLDRATIVRTNEDKTTEVFHVNLDSIMNGWSKFELESWDSIHVFSRYDMLANQDSIAVEGFARQPGKYPLHEGLTLYDVVYEHAGLADTLYRPKVYLQRADLIRLNPDRYTSRICIFNLWDLYQHRTKDTLLLPGDRIIFYPITAIALTDRYVDISGSVKNPGRYKFSENMSVLDLLIEAGGYTEDAWPEQAEVSRLERKGIGRDSLMHLIKVSIPDLFDPDNLTPVKIAEYRKTSFPLQHRDQVFIRSNPNYIFQQSVTLDGEVEHPGSYVLSKLNEYLSDVIKRAGGIKKAGYPEAGKLIRRGSRMRIDISKAIDDPEGNDDIILQPIDTIAIPKQPFAVQVSGEVNNPGLFSYVDGKSTWFYLKSSGGITDSADFILVTYPTGIVEQVGTHWWSGNPKIPDGSSIVVTKVKPEPPEPITTGPKTTTFDFVKDMLAVVVSAVTVIVLAQKL